jgi:predicted O-methyltransferase YrrM
MENLQYLKNKFNLDFNGKLPIKVPIDRFRGLTSLFKELGFKVGAEIGVSKGRYSKWICSYNRKAKLYCIDPWKAYPDYIEKHKEDDQKEMDEIYEFAKNRLKNFNCEFVRKTSMEAIKDFNDNSLDFVFIDGNHTFEYVVNDIAEWEKKVKPGGIISGHDFWNSDDLKTVWATVETPRQKMKLCQVQDAILAWTNTNEIKPWFVTKDRCWFYFK